MAGGEGRNEREGGRREEGQERGDRREGTRGKERECGDGQGKVQREGGRVGSLGLKREKLKKGKVDLGAWR